MSLEKQKSFSTFSALGSHGVMTIMQRTFYKAKCKNGHEFRGDADSIEDYLSKWPCCSKCGVLYRKSDLTESKNLHARADVEINQRGKITSTVVFPNNRHFVPQNDKARQIDFGLEELMRGLNMDALEELE
jgi:hypothetical protein